MTESEWGTLRIGQEVYAPYSGRFYRIRGIGAKVHKADEFDSTGRLLKSFIDLTRTPCFEMGSGGINGKSDDSRGDSQ